MTRVECMRQAAIVEHEAREWDRIDPRFSVSAREDRDNWRARGKEIPRRVGMVCARARRRQRRRNDPKMRVRERDLWMVLANFGATPRVIP